MKVGFSFAMASQPFRKRKKKKGPKMKKKIIGDQLHESLMGGKGACKKKLHFLGICPHIGGGGGVARIPKLVLSFKF